MLNYRNKITTLIWMIHKSSLFTCFLPSTEDNELSLWGQPIKKEEKIEIEPSSS
jgi:hypothetical protein